MKTDASLGVTSELFSTESVVETGRALANAVYDEVASVGSKITKVATEHPYATIGSAIVLSAAAIALLKRMPVTRVARGLEESSTSVFPHYVQEMDASKNTLIIGKLKDLERYAYKPGEFSLSWTTTSRNLEVPKNLQLLDHWLIKGGQVRDISEATLKSPSEHLYWERAFIKRYPPAEGSYVHLPTGATTPPAERLPWQSLNFNEPRQNPVAAIIESLRGTNFLRRDQMATRELMEHILGKKLA